jgi:Protein of unknown function (DUF3108)
LANESWLRRAATGTRALVLGLALTGAAQAQGSGRAPPACLAEQPWPTRLAMEFAVSAARGALALAGDNQLVFRIEGDRYELRSSTRSLLFTAEQASRGSVEGRLLRPAEYVEHSPRRGQHTTRFDWDAGTVRFTANIDGTAATAPFLQDRLTLLLQLGQWLRGAERGDPELPVAGLRDVSAYRFQRRGSAATAVPAGTFETLRLERKADAGGAMEVWLAPALCWLPVRLRYTDDRGLVVDNQLRRIAFD